jgi:hypothetical protein
MKFRICIDRISLDGLAWSASQRRLFESSFAAVLHEAIASQAGGPPAGFSARRVGFESLSIGSIDAGNPEQAARALAFPLTTQLLASPGGGSVGAPKTGAS